MVIYGNILIWNKQWLSDEYRSKTDGNYTFEYNKFLSMIIILIF